uniref:Uncharacterized protein n=2 Tax=Guillardia theta TaxID=55529 RepID=A0A7S4PRA4_GUITH|mmetsp:Transcript_8386/g.28162  ORF Transcript_8386/g.28162 Transcript_8386/m.28162 type:complete len:111 (+) Transcript_8386:96-428(+)
MEENSEMKESFGELLLVSIRNAEECQRNLDLVMQMETRSRREESWTRRREEQAIKEMQSYRAECERLRAELEVKKQQLSETEMRLFALESSRKELKQECFETLRAWRAMQ